MTAKCLYLSANRSCWDTTSRSAIQTSPRCRRYSGITSHPERSGESRLLFTSQIHGIYENVWKDTILCIDKKQLGWGPYPFTKLKESNIKTDPLLSYLRIIACIFPCKIMIPPTHKPHRSRKKRNTIPSSNQTLQCGNIRYFYNS